MILDADLLKEIAKAPVEKRAITNHRVLNEAFDYPKPSSIFTRHAHRLERAGHLADLGNGQHR